MKRFVAVLSLLLSSVAIAGGSSLPPGLDDTAEQIRNGTLDVGKVNSMGFPGRFHSIHAKALGMGCLECHTHPGHASDQLFLRKAEFPQRGHPGAVDRSTCIACHKEGGAATPWYRLTGSSLKGAAR